MQYIEDMYPLRILDADAYRKYTAMRKERERFLKNSRNVCHTAWNIHRKLYDERFSKVYLQVARGQDKQRALEEYLSLLEEGRDVKVVTSKDITAKKFEKPITLKDIIEDKDLFFPDPWRKRMDELINEAIYKDFAKHIAKEYESKMYIDTTNPYEWKPKVAPDAYIFHGDYVYPHYMGDAFLCNIVKDSILEVIDTMKGD
jgi:hypothetical protein